MNRIHSMRMSSFSHYSLFVLMIFIMTLGNSCRRQSTHELPREISSFPPLAKNEALVYFEEDSDKSTEKNVYFTGKVYRNKKSDNALLYSNEKVMHWGPFSRSADKQIMFLKTDDEEHTESSIYKLHGLYMIDGRRGKVYKIANTAAYVNVSDDSEYTIYNDPDYLLGQKSRIILISNIELKKIYEKIIPGELSYHRGKPCFIWDKASKTFQFMIIAQDEYWEEYKIDVINKTTARIFRSTEKYIGE